MPGSVASSGKRLPTAKPTSARRSIVGTLRSALATPRPSVRQSLMQDVVRCYAAASALALEAGLACVRQAVALSRLCTGLDQLAEAPHRAGCLRRRSGAPQSEILVATARALPLPLHPDLMLLGQRRRSLVGQAYPTTPQTRRLHLDHRAAGRHHFIADANAKPKPCVWTKSADAILAAVSRGRQALEAVH